MGIRPGSSPRRREQQEYGRRIEQDRNHQDEPAQDILIAGAEQGCQISDRAEVGLGHPLVAVDLGLLDLQVGKGLSLNRKLVGKAGALGLPALVIRGAELSGCRKCCRLGADGRSGP